MSIKSKLLIVFAALIVIPFLTVGVVTYTKSKEELRQQALVNLTDVANSKSIAVKTYLKEKKNQVHMLCSKLSLKLLMDSQSKYFSEDSMRYNSMKNDFLYKEMREYAEITDFYRFVFIDLKGHPVLQYNSISKDRKRYAREIQRADQFEYGNIIYDSSENHFALNLLVGIPKLGSDFELIGYALVTMNTNNLEQLLSQKPGTDSKFRCQLKDRKGYQTVLFSESSNASQKFNNRVDKSTAGINEGKRYKMIKYLSKSPWTLEVSVSESSVLAPIQNVKPVFIFGAIIFLLAAIFTGFWMSRKLVNPIVLLNQAFLKLSKGIKSEEIELHQRDELGKVALAHNHLVITNDIIVSSLQKIAGGDHSIKLTPRSKKDRLVNTINTMVETLATQDLEIERQQQREQQDRVQLEKANHRLESSLKDVQLLSYNVAHTITPPLRSIKSFTQKLNVEYRDQFDDRSYRWLNFVEQNTLKIEEAMKDLYEYLNMGKRDAVITSVDTAGIINREVKSLSREFKNVEVNVGEIPQIMGDREMMKVMWRNVLHNAFKFSHNSPQPLVKIQFLPLLEEYQIHIIDNGIGISGNHSGKMFDLFESNHMEQEYIGKGNGLAFVKLILEKHRGSIQVDSIPNSGTSIIITLPKKGAIKQNP